jgi:site-specific DNA recombinase
VPSEQLQRCAIYTRKSVDEGLDREFSSLETQRSTCSAYILSQRHRGWLEISQRYDDGGYSGASLTRPAMERLLTDIEAGRIDVVVIYKIDRLTRSLIDFARLADVFERFDVSFVSITQSFDTGDSMGRLILHVLLTFAQFERELLSDRLRDKFAAMRRKGKPIGGLAPFGYNLVDRRLVINAHEARIIRSIYERYPSSKSGNQLLKQLREEGVRNKYQQTKAGRRIGGSPISAGLFHKIMSNPLYVGQISYQGQIYDGEHEAIVSREQWDKVQAVRQGRTKDQIPRGPNRDLLAGLFFDSHGRRMKPGSSEIDGTTYRYYHSEQTRRSRRKGLPTTRTNAEEAESVARAGIRSFFQDRSALLSALVSIGQFDEETLRQLARGSEAAARAGKMPDGQLRLLFQALLRRVEVGRESVVLIICCVEAARFLAWDGVGRFKPSADVPARHASRVHLVEVPASIVREQFQFMLPIEPLAEVDRGKPDPLLIELLERAKKAQALVYKNRHMSINQLAKRAHTGPSFFARLIKLNYLAPDILAAIIDGRHPPELSRHKLIFSPLPLDWRLQREMLGFPPVKGADGVLVGRRKKLTSKEPEVTVHRRRLTAGKTMTEGSL